MKRVWRVLAGLLLACTAVLDASAQLSCTLVPSPAVLTGAYNPAQNLDLQGSLTLNCQRASRNDPRNYTVRVGIGHASGQTLATTGAFADTLTYGLYRDANRTNLWTNGAAATSGAGSQSVSISFSGNNLTMAAPVTLTVYMRVPSGQSGKAAGTYSHATAAYVYDNSNGTLLDDISFTPEATIGKNCSISSGTATQYNVSYTAFRSTPLVDTTSGIPVSCTRGTQYTLSLDATSGVIPTVQLAYTLTFANGTGSVTATPSSEATNTHILTLTLPAGQAGTCNAGTCTGTSTRTVTITY